MQIVYLDDLHEILFPIFWKQKKNKKKKNVKYHQLAICWICPKSGKCNTLYEDYLITVK